MKIGWKKKQTKSGGYKRSLPILSHYPNLPFEPQHEEEEEEEEEEEKQKKSHHSHDKALASSPPHDKSDLELAESFQSQGNQLAEDGRYQEALGKWEASLTLKPERAVVHEQKAQVLLEIGDAWNALKAASRATELEPSWGEAWITLARAQLNFGEPDAAIESFDRALAIKPDSKDAKEERQTAMHHVKKRKQLHLSGLSENENRYVVGDTAKSS